MASLRRLPVLASTVLVASLLAGAAATVAMAATVITGQATTGDPVGGRPQAPGASSCGVFAPPAGVSSPSGVFYDAYPFANASPSAATCVTVTVSHPCTPGSPPPTVHVVAYQTAYDPSSPLTNLIGGGTSFCGSTTQTFGFTLPAGAIFTLVAFAGGAPGASSGPYTITVDATGAGVTPLFRPTAVTFRSVSVARTKLGPLVRWRTAFEVDAVGYDVYREVNGTRARINRTLIPAKGGGLYSLLDRRAPRGKIVRYWIRAVSLDGSRQWYGPARVRSST